MRASGMPSASTVATVMALGSFDSFAAASFSQAPNRANGSAASISPSWAAWAAA